MTIEMKHFSLIIIALLFSTTVFAQNNIETDFTQTKVMKVSGKTTEKAGHIIFDGNDHLTMNYTQPEGEYFIIESNMVKINMDGKKAELDANKVKMVGLQRSTRQLGTGCHRQQRRTDYHRRKRYKDRLHRCQRQSAQGRLQIGCVDLSPQRRQDDQDGFGRGYWGY